MAATTTPSCFIAFLFFSACCALPASDDDTAFAQSLLKFKKSLTNTAMLDGWREPAVANLCSWNTPVWTGCLCSNGSFVGLRLEGMGLGGAIDVDALSELPLFSFSVMRNNFSGPIPSGINRLARLRSLYLANNGFNGEIPDAAFSGMKQMVKIAINDNFFTGKIPASLLELPRLVSLQLQGNRFEGRIPEFWQGNLTVNLSDNKLEGLIPVNISNKNASFFSGNLRLCGKPLAPCSKPKKPVPKIAFVAATIAGSTLAAVILILLLCRMRAKPLQYEKSVHSFAKEEPRKRAFKKNEYGKLYFVRNDCERFKLEDLLKAAAEVLGSGSFGSSYKAVLCSGQSYVVRRFRQMSNVGREDFYEHMRRLGRLSHPNVQPLVACYYRREEKLLISPFVENGSLASHLHGKRRSDQPGLDWPTRLRIVKGVARGLAYLYKELPTLTLPHGHLKSSNVLLDRNYKPLLTDYALEPVMNREHAQQFMVSYKSPESTKNDCITRKTDAWSLGILILELLTGQFPANYLKQGRGPSSDLATWVDSVLREEWTGEMFDKDMKVTKHSEGQMLRLLKIGMCCCEWNVERRWDLRQAVGKIEELMESDDGHASYASAESQFLFSRA